MQRASYIGAAPSGGGGEPPVGGIIFSETSPGLSYQRADQPLSAPLLVEEYRELSRLSPLTGLTVQTHPYSGSSRLLCRLADTPYLFSVSYDTGEIRKRHYLENWPSSPWYSSGYDWRSTWCFGAERGLSCCYFPLVYEWEGGASFRVIRVHSDSGTPTNFGFGRSNDMAENESGVVVNASDGAIGYSNAYGANGTWASTTPSGGYNWIAVVWTGEEFVAFAQVAGVLARSTNGSVWSVTTGVPGMAAPAIKSYHYATQGMVRYHPKSHRIFMVCTDGSIRSVSADNPTAAWTNHGVTDVNAALAVVSWGLIAYTRATMWGLKDGDGPLLTLVDGTLPWKDSAFNRNPGPACYEFGDGYICIETSPDFVGSWQLNYRFADMVTRFDRLTITAPYLGGKYPWIKVK